MEPSTTDRDSDVLPLVSIIINNYNYEPYLAQSIDSALAQTYKRTEIVVVDDGSTDGSAEILNAYDERIRVVRQPNQGQVAALNAGVANAKGAVLVFLDADDRFVEDKLEQLMRHASRLLVSEVPCCIFDWYHRIEANGTRIKASRVQEFFRRLKQMAAKRNRGLRRLSRPEKVLRDIADFGYSPRPAVEGTSRITINREASNAIFPLDPSGIKICADALLVKVGSLYADFFELNLPLTDYRLHGSNNWSSAVHKTPIDLEGAVATNVNRHLGLLGATDKWRRPEDSPSWELVARSGWSPFFKKLHQAGARPLRKMTQLVYVSRTILMRKAASVLRR